MNIKTTKQYLGYVLTGLKFQCYGPILFLIQKMSFWFKLPYMLPNLQQLIL